MRTVVQRYGEGAAIGLRGGVKARGGRWACDSRFGQGCYLALGHVEVCQVLGLAYRLGQCCDLWMMVRETVVEDTRGTIEGETAML